MQLLLKLTDECKVREIEDIDSVAQISDPFDSLLYKFVSKHVVHVSSGNLNPHCICMEEGKCEKEFSECFNETTKENVNSYGYPVYQ